tara:strand:- start:16 stop:1047 length:1032 start_codon:yes stop_codon:yes gene_type:complete
MKIERLNFQFKKNWLKILLGLIFTISSGIFLFKIINDFELIVDLIISVNKIIVLGCILVYGGSLFVRTLRWKFILNKKNNIKYLYLLKILSTGYMFNNLLPARLGEIARIFHFNLRNNLKKSYLLGTILTERISDVIALIILLIFGIILISEENMKKFQESIGISSTSIYFIIIICTGLILIFLTLSSSGYWKLIINNLIKLKLFRRLNNKFNFKLIVNDFLNGAFSVDKGKDLAILIFLALSVWAVEFSMFYLLATTINLGLDSIFIPVLIFGVLSNLSGIIPSTAGGWGPFELVGSLVLMSFGVNIDVAAAYTIMVHIILWLPISIIGLILFINDLRYSNK